MSNQIERFDSLDPLDQMDMLAELYLDGNHIVKSLGFEDYVLQMVPMLEVLNGTVLAEPGTRFKREAEKIKENLNIEIQLEEAKEELLL